MGPPKYMHTNEEWGEDSLLEKVLMPFLEHHHNFVGVPTHLCMAAWGTDRRIKRYVCNTRAVVSLGAQTHGGIVHTTGMWQSGYRLFGKERLGWQGEYIAIYMREQQKYMELCLGTDEPSVMTDLVGKGKQ